MERRRQERTQCSIPCAVVRGRGKPVDGTVRNISAGGLSVQVDLDVDQGDVLHLTLQPNRRNTIEVEAIVWHDTRVKLKATGKATSRLGLVLSEAPEAFIRLLPPPKPREPKAVATPTPKAPPRPEPPKSPEPPKPTGLPKPKRYRIRVKQDSAPRTRSILVFADSFDEARESGLVETGPGWHILEVERA